MAEVAEPSFAALLKRHRVEADLTQEVLAERATLSVRAISDLERGVKHRPFPHTVRRLSLALDLDEEAAECFKAAARRSPAEEGGAEEPVDGVGSTISLPVPPTSFIGRKREIEEVSALLCRDEVRLLTLIGPGGVGKTRLAVRVVEHVQHAFPDGVVFVPLASLAEAGLVLSTIARFLRVEAPTDQPILDSLIANLRRKRLLLVLDNFEQLLPAADGLSTLLESCPRMTMLATSRAMLHLAAEHEYGVPSLSVPVDLSRWDALGRYDAIQLFVQRARAVKPGFELIEENAEAIAEICRRLEGLPLAIELAAVHIRIFSPRVLLARLSDPLQLLTGGPRDAPVKQQTMRATIEWSYRLLSEQERTLMLRLAVSAGGCTLEAAEALCEGADYRRGEVLACLESLVDQSLLSVDEVDGEPRFRMLETVREYALEQLLASGETENVRRRHAEVFLRLAEEVEREASATEQGERRARLQREHDNLRAALAWSLEHEGAAEIALRLAGALVWFWDSFLYMSEGRRWLERCVPLSAASDVAERCPRAWAQVLSGIAGMAARQGDFAAARTYGELGLSVWRTLEDKHGLASALSTLGWVAHRRGDHRQAQALLHEQVELSRDFGGKEDRISALFQLAQAEMHQGNLSAARSRLEEALVLVRRVGNSTILVAVLCQLAEVAWSQGDTSAQRAFYGEGLATLPDLTEPPGRFHMLGMLAGMARRMGDYEQAEKLLMERLAVARDQLGSAQNGWFVAWALNHLGDVARCREDPSRATALYEESLAVFRQNGERQGIAAALHNLGHVALTQGDTGRARALFTESLTVFRELGFEWSMADCLMGLAGVAEQEGYPAQAAVLYGTAETAHQAVDASGILVEPANQLAWERDMATVRSKLDEHMWARAWEAGRAMTLEQAIGYALEETGGVPAV